MRSFTKSLLPTVLVLLLASSAFADPAMRVSGAIWAHDTLYDTVITDTSFLLPPMGSTDVLYDFSMSGLMGQRSVSESAPGDRNYNGGRWSVKMVVFTQAGIAVHDPDGDGMVNFELTNATQVLQHADDNGLDHFDIFDTSKYFECPLLPRKGPRNND